MCLALSLQAGSRLCVSWPLEAGDFTRRHVRAQQVWTQWRTRLHKQLGAYLHAHRCREKRTHTHTQAYTLLNCEQICIIMLLTLPSSWPSHAGPWSTWSNWSSLCVCARTDRTHLYTACIYIHACAVQRQTDIHARSVFYKSSTPSPYMHKWGTSACADGNWH